jgi:Skp family chaperone for outer membrane proteins
MSAQVRPALRALAGILSALIVASAAVAAQAQDTKPAATAKVAPTPGAGPVFIVIDLERIRRESLAGKSINAEAEKYGKAVEDENRKAEAALRSGEQELQKQRGTLPAEQFAEKARAFEQKVSETQRTELRRRQALERSYNLAMVKWQQAMMEASRDVASSHNADAVVQSQALLFYNTKWDATNEVLDLMNKRVAKIDFPPPKMEPEAGAPSAAQQSQPKQLQTSPQPPSGGLKLPQQ